MARELCDGQRTVDGIGECLAERSGILASDVLREVRAAVRALDEAELLEL